jgi:formylglycine-generating enzyme required for sulfatase activity
MPGFARPSFLRPLSLSVSTALLLLASAASAVTIDWVPVGNPGNAADTSANCYSANCGAVNYPYFISKYDVTKAQYVEFLNTVDPNGTNTLGLWNSFMQTNIHGGITFASGNPSGSKYVVNPTLANAPVDFVGFSDALRFANWLNNGQGAGSTETGAYTLLGGTPNASNVTTVTRNPGAQIFLPSENEWYKAAYYNPITNSYFTYPYGSSTPTTCAAPGATPNTANCAGVVDHFTSVGAYTGSTSPYGAYDMGGNAFQWNEEIVAGVSRGIRGGGFGDLATGLASSRRGFAGATGEHGNVIIGFRVAAVIPEPSTGTLLMTGLLGLAYRQRRHRRAA